MMSILYLASTLSLTGRQLKMGLFELLNELMAIHVVSGEAVLSGHKAQCRD